MSYGTRYSAHGCDSYDHNARYSFMTIDDFIDMGLRSSDEKKYYIENLCVAFSLLQ